MQGTHGTSANELWLNHPDFRAMASMWQPIFSRRLQGATSTLKGIPEPRCEIRWLTYGSIEFLQLAHVTHCYYSQCGYIEEPTMYVSASVITAKDFMASHTTYGYWVNF